MEISCILSISFTAFCITVNAMPYADVDRVSKMIPTELGMTIDKALKMNTELKRAYDKPLFQM